MRFLNVGGVTTYWSIKTTFIYHLLLQKFMYKKKAVQNNTHMLGTSIHYNTAPRRGLNKDNEQSIIFDIKQPHDSSDGKNTRQRTTPVPILSYTKTCNCQVCYKRKYGVVNCILSLYYYFYYSNTGTTSKDRNMRCFEQQIHFYCK